MMMTKQILGVVGSVVLAVVGAGCVPQQQQPQPQYGQYQPQAYAQPQPYEASQYGQQPDATQAGYGQEAPQPGGVTATATVGARRIAFNGHAATAQDLQIVAQIERALGRMLPDGSYWYDSASGAAGVFGGPTLGFLPPGMALGGPLPANASGGGNGMLTGVFINGREIHPQDAAYLQQLLGQLVPGRYWVDAQGNAGQEGGPALVNLIQVARQRGQQRGGNGGGSYYRSDGRDNNVFAGGGCVAVNGSTGSGDDKSSYSYYSSGCE